MTPERWLRVKEVLAMVLAEPAARQADALDAACRGDTALRRDAGELLAARADVGDFLETPLFGDPEPPVAADDIPDDLRAWTRYEILELVGRGGMASVYRARDPRLQRTVAIKIMSGSAATTVQRFLREAEMQARLEHDNVLKVFETGTVGAHHYIAMQYVAGPALSGVRDETTLEHKVLLMRRVAEGLHAAHREGLIHRDIKPGNILVERGDDGLKPYLLDFGLAIELGAPALTQDGVVIGTPRYMAPERVAGGMAAVDRRSDIYSLGATFYEFLSGVAPFGEQSGLQILVNVMRDDLTPIGAVMPSLPRELAAVISKCLDPDPQRRYGSARLLAEDLGRYLDGEPVMARPSGWISRTARRARKHPRVAAAFGALALLVLAAAGWGGYAYWRTARQTSLAQTLGQQMQDIEWMLRAAQMSPLHSIRPEKLEVRRRLARIEDLVANAGTWARAPGNYALGRGFLTLGEPSRARDYLARAWDAGYRTPDAAFALGLAHSEVFRIESARAQRIASDEARAAQLEALAREHRDAAVRFLEAGRHSAIATPRYTEALLAAHRGDLAAAVTKAGEAARETPWLFEAKLLPGHLEMNAAAGLYQLGKIAEAEARARAADGYYAEAHRIAPSSAEAYIGRCAVSGLLLHMAVHLRTVASQERVSVCADALTVAPDSSEAARLYSEAVRYWGNTKVVRREDPGNAYDMAEGLAQRAVRQSDGAVGDLAALAGLYMDRGWWESRTERDPRRSVDLAVAAFDQVLEIDPRNDASANERGQSLLLRSRYEAARALDPSGSYDRAIDSFKRALTISPSTAFHLATFSSAAVERARSHVRRGIDPAPALLDALGFLDGLPGDKAALARVAAVRRVQARLDER